VDFENVYLIGEIRVNPIVIVELEMGDLSEEILGFKVNF
jgi:hypothetical protein